ncbi:MAG: hypothetical protein ICV79_08405 [Flavisolibacter sp.]|nr:hypothetical protein [Flavisolibacter sp.]
MRYLFLVIFIALLYLKGNGQFTKIVYNDSAFSNTILSEHNLQRKEVGVPPLQWSSSLAEDALLWAKQLAQKGGGIEHDPNRKKEGENIWGGTANRRSYKEMVGAWTREKADFVYGPLDFASLSKVGHYTQMIWQSTTQIGCALVSNGKMEYLVCRYLPQGNYTGQKPYR